MAGANQCYWGASRSESVRVKCREHETCPAAKTHGLPRHAALDNQWAPVAQEPTAASRRRATGDHGNAARVCGWRCSRWPTIFRKRWQTVLGIKPGECLLHDSVVAEEVMLTGKPSLRAWRCWCERELCNREPRRQTRGRKVSASAVMPPVCDDRSPVTTRTVKCYRARAQLPAPRRQRTLDSGALAKVGRHEGATGAA